MENWLPYLLQTNDSQFPNGSYAHSFGLEEMISLGQVNNADQLRDFLACEVADILTHQELPYVRYAYEAAELRNITLLADLDREIDTWRLAEESRSASIALGTHRLQMLAKLYSSDFLTELIDCQKSSVLYGHQITVSAVQGIVCQTPLIAVLWSYLYQAYASYIAAALKLLRMGQDQCQRLLTERLSDGKEMIHRSLQVERDQAGTSIAILDIAASRHATAFSRLFIS